MSRNATRHGEHRRRGTAGVSAASTIVSKTPTPPGICDASPATCAAMNSPSRGGKESGAPRGRSSRSTSAASVQSAAETATCAGASGSEGGLKTKPRIVTSLPRAASAR